MATAHVTEYLPTFLGLYVPDDYCPGMRPREDIALIPIAEAGGCHIRVKAGVLL